ncbi:FAD-containing oxidoreductase [Sphingobium lignivorans]|uniref:Pyruvate/2-oxoglutarate dehydrogenase complex dihydrolipoamide dehydrogenase (E3) component n=1 Tax=Sphingobium lignivorans TaxID=2735886 RepID=A0ABR6NBU7_9SPHN|nr:FAD-containing oxidoreductase [Sphingobium lignivorans]MBB5984751.1 pyruvate/2-oxoglutarate dehydrogenase complex dihydrolipoamide dehydrogenase (E3) component [Sphingobium lignivorans]
MSQSFDAIIIGAGQAGPPLAGRLTAAGMNVALIERKLIGGTCVNTGCMPTKALVASAYAAHLARRHDLGVIARDVRVDMKAVAARAQKVASDARGRNESWLGKMDGLTLLRGHARLTGPTSVTVDGAALTAPRIFLNVGGRASVPDMPGVGDVPHLDNTDMVALDSLPAHLVVVGGSYIGLEFAQMYARFGARVTIVERAGRLIAREDPEISEAIRDFLEAEGITVRTDADCIGFKPHPNGAIVTVACRSGEPEVVGSHVLLAVGRRPNTDDLGLDAAGVATDERGYIKVDDRLATNVPGIWALGDCNGRGAFTHTAYNDFEIVAANLLDGEDRRLSQRITGYALYTDPPLGRAGMTETEARAKGHDILVSTRPMSRVGRAVEKGETLGLMKVIAERTTRRILGAAILGTSGDEAIHGIIDAMSADEPFDTLRWAVPVHPTVSELIPTLLLGLDEGKA